MNERPRQQKVNVDCGGCLTRILIAAVLMVMVGVGAWSLFGFDVREAAGIGVLGGVGIMLTPCAVVGAAFAYVSWADRNRSPYR